MSYIDTYNYIQSTAQHHVHTETQEQVFILAAGHGE